MSFSTQDIELLRKAKQEGKTKEQALALLSQNRQSAEPSTTTSEPGLGSKLVDRYKEGVSGMAEQPKDVLTGQATPIQGVGRFFSRPLGAAGRAVGDVIGAGMSKIPGFTSATEKVAEFAQPAIEPVMERYSRLKETNPKLAQDIEDALGMTELLGAGMATRPVAQVARRAGENVADTAMAGAKAAGPVADVAKGIATQVGDFGRRTATDAMDTAAQSRRLAEMPEPTAKLIRAGADERVVSLIENSTPTERNIYRDLVQAAKTKEGDLEAPQPKIIAGQEFMKPVDHLLKQRDQVGSQLGELRTTLSNSNNVNINPYFREFQRYLTEDLGLRVDNKGNLIAGRGRVADSDLKEIQKLYNDLKPETVGVNFKSQKWIDEYLQRTFKEFDLRQAREQTFSDDVTRAAERARQSLRQAMPEEYNSLSTQYASVMKPIQEVVKLLGYKGDINKLTAKELKAAEVALRVLGNASDRPQSTIDNVLEAAQATGYTSDVDLKRIILLADQLEDLYDITPSRSFSGSASRGVNQSALGAVGDAASMNVPGLFSKAMSSSASKKEVQEAFEAYLNSLD